LGAREEILDDRRIELSDRCVPGRSTLVESENKSATPSSTQLREAIGIEELPIDWSWVDLKIARMYDQPGRRANRERHRIGRGVVTRTASTRNGPSSISAPGCSSRRSAPASRLRPGRAGQMQVLLQFP